MSILRAFVTVLVSGVVGAALGTLIGYTLAVVTPGYYATVFPGAARTPGFNPVEVGIGLGLSQGLIVGLVIGCVVVLAVAITSRFRAPAISTDAVEAFDHAPRSHRPPSTDVTI